MYVSFNWVMNKVMFRCVFGRERERGRQGEREAGRVREIEREGEGRKERGMGKEKASVCVLSDYVCEKTCIDDH